MRRVIVASLFAIAAALFVAFFNGLRDVNSVVPSWWQWLGITGALSFAAALLVATPIKVWAWLIRPSVNHGPIRAWRALRDHVANLESRATNLETRTEPLGSAAQVKERRSDLDQWKHGLSQEVERLRSEVRRLEGN